METVHIDTARQMQSEVLARFTDADAVIMSAAVADYRPKTVAAEKIKKSDDELVLHLEGNPDILFDLVSTRPGSCWSVLLRHAVLRNTQNGNW